MTIQEESLNPRSILNDYLELLGHDDFCLDYWEDEALDDAQGFAEKLTPADWEELNNIWASQAVGWQVRCAQSLTPLDNPQALALLCAMLESSNSEAAIAAAESLKVIDWWKPNDAQRVTLERLLEKVDDFDGKTLRSLLARPS